MITPSGQPIHAAGTPDLDLTPTRIGELLRDYLDLIDQVLDRRPEGETEWRLQQVLAGVRPRQHPYYTRPAGVPGGMPGAGRRPAAPRGRRTPRPAPEPAEPAVATRADRCDGHHRRDARRTTQPTWPTPLASIPTPPGSGDTPMAEYLRLNHSSLQTPVRSYWHPATGRRISLVTVLKAGEAGYYHDLRHTVTTLEQAGTIVYTDDWPRLLPRDLHAAGLSGIERAALAMLAHAENLHADQVATLGWVCRRDGLPPAAGWQTVDISPLETIRQGTVSAEHILRVAQDRSARWTCSPGVFRLMTTVQLRWAANVTPDMEQATTERLGPVIGHRTRHVLAALHATTHDAALLWAPGHLPAMHTDLLSRSYLHAGDLWHTVGRFPTVPAALRDLLLRRTPWAVEPPGPRRPLPVDPSPRMTVPLPRPSESLTWRKP